MYNNTFQFFKGIGITLDESIIPTTTQVNAGNDVHIEAVVNYIIN